MRDLSAHREGWETVEAEETRLLRSMTAQEGIRRWLILQRSFEAQLQQTTALFGPERRAALAQLQARLRRLAEWQEQHGEFALLSPDYASLLPDPRQALKKQAMVFVQDALGTRRLAVRVGEPPARRRNAAGPAGHALRRARAAADLNVPLYNGSLFQTDLLGAADQSGLEAVRFLRSHKIPDRYLAIELDQMAR